MSDTVAHIVGPALTMDSRSRGRVQRQRCLWCGALILETELDRVAVQLPADGSEPKPPATWEAGAVVEMAGEKSGQRPGVSAAWLVEVADDELLPGNACANLDHAVTA